MTESMIIRGGCLCGKMRFTASPKDKDVGACHCSMCRRWSAGPFMVRDCGTSVAVEDTTHLGAYRSSESAERAFCKQCGTPLYYRLIQQNQFYVSSEAPLMTARAMLSPIRFLSTKSPPITTSPTRRTT